MKNLEIIFRLLRRHLSLRAVNLAGLSIVLVSLLVSVNHIRRELDWDRYNANAERIVRLVLAREGEPVDGRVHSSDMLDGPLLQLPEVEAIAKLHEVYRPDLVYRGIHLTAGAKVFYVNRDFLRTFDLEMVEGEAGDALEAGGQVIVSESLARRLAGLQGGDVLGTDLSIEGVPCHITGIFQDIPETSHWRGDALALMPEDMSGYCYTYLLLREGSNLEELERKITAVAGEMDRESTTPLRAGLMPLTDIHLHSHNLRELSVNGNISYIWLVTGANVLLLFVVFFNLWLNGSLIFSYNRRFYQLLRLHGAPVSVILRNEGLQALCLGIVAVALGLIMTAAVFGYGLVPGEMGFRTTAAVSSGFLVLIVAVAVLPALRNMAQTRFLNGDSQPFRFSYANVRWMLVVQYTVVMAVLILAVGISRQLNTIENVQVGGDGRDVMVMDGVPEEAMERYPVLRERLGRSPLIKAVTTSFQLPGSAILDFLIVRRMDSPDLVRLPVMVAGDGFLQFYDIPLLAGEDFAPLPYGFTEEREMFVSFMRQSERGEQYIINRKALKALGFNTPEEAVGQPLEIMHGSLDYINHGVIAGVTEDYNYTGAFEEDIPLIMLNRNLFQFCLMVRTETSRADEAMRVLEAAWTEVFPDRQSSFEPLSEVYRSLYRNEFNARDLVLAFTFLCLVIADLGLVIFMAFIIRRRTREIAIRKVNGATAGLIVRMLNANFVRYIGVAFILAVPVSWLILHSWLQRFAFRTTLDWWIFAASGAAVLLVSLLSVSLQSWRAATINPVRGLRK